MNDLQRFSLQLMEQLRVDFERRLEKERQQRLVAERHQLEGDLNWLNKQYGFR